MAGNHNSGRKPLPTRIKELQGTLQGVADTSYPVGEKLRTVEECRLRVPFSKMNKRQKDFFDEVCRQQMALGLLEAAYLPQLYFLAVVWDDMLEAERDIKKNGRYSVRKDELGNACGIVKNPSIADRRDAWEIVRQISSAYGMTPVDRQRLRMKSEGGGKTSNLINIILGKDEEPDEQG